jgi:hypothetical protein
MFDISFIEIVIVLVVLLIAVLVFFPKKRAEKPKRPERWEKAEIVKQLLALSELENSLASTAPSFRSSASASKHAMRPANTHLKANASRLPIRSKTSRNRLHQ